MGEGVGSGGACAGRWPEVGSDSDPKPSFGRTAATNSSQDRTLQLQPSYPPCTIDTMRKQLDPRIPSLITNGVSANHRSFFVLVGDKGKDQVVNLHFLLSQTRVSARPSVLWCYKKDLGFTSCVRSSVFLRSIAYDGCFAFGQAPQEARGKDQAGCQAWHPRGQRAVAL